jgi:hypothetical protein
VHENLFNFYNLFTMPRRRRPDIGPRNQSNVRRGTSLSNCTDEQRAIGNDNSFIGISELRYRMTENRSLDRMLKDLCDNHNNFGGAIILKVRCFSSDSSDYSPINCCGRTKRMDKIMKLVAARKDTLIDN